MGCTSSSYSSEVEPIPVELQDEREPRSCLRRTPSKTLLELRRQNSKGSQSSKVRFDDNSLQANSGEPLVNKGCDDNGLQAKSGKPLVNKGAQMILKQGTCTYLSIDEGRAVMPAGGSIAGTVEERVRQRIRRKDLTSKGLLGCGGFGKVELVEHNDSNETFALKTVNKAHLHLQKLQRSVIDEKNTQMMCDSQFIIKLYETYSDSNNLYLLLELSLGGEVKQTYYQKDFFGSERHTRFYLAGCVYALQHIHERNIIFRDLKPENMLITETGHVKLADFGIAKVSEGKTFTACGTLEYSAPEMFGCLGHAHAADWWALGITAFELMTGRMPFQASDLGGRRGRPSEAGMKEATLRTVSEGGRRGRFCKEVQGACEDFVKELCRDDPAQRLPMRQGGVNNIQTHQWFKDFDWEAMHNMTLEPPYKPCVESNTDIANFFECPLSDLPPQIPFEGYDDGSGWYAEFATND